MAWILRGEQLTPVSECLEDVHEFPETTLAELQASYRRCAPDESCGGGAVVPNERPGPSGSDESGNPIRSAVIGASAFAVARRRGAGSDRGSPIGWPCCTEDADAGRCRWLNCQGLGCPPRRVHERRRPRVQYCRPGTDRWPMGEVGAVDSPSTVAVLVAIEAQHSVAGSAASGG